jgi:hypothetical protein
VRRPGRPGSLGLSGNRRGRSERGGLFRRADPLVCGRRPRRPLGRSEIGAKPLRVGEPATIISASGRQAYIKGSHSTVWMVMLIARSYKNDAKKTAKHFEWPLESVEAAFQYATAFPKRFRMH